MSSIPLSDVRALRDAAQVMLELIGGLASARKHWSGEMDALRNTIARLDPQLVYVPLLIQVTGLRAMTVGAVDGGEGRRVAVMSAFAPRDRVHVTSNLYGSLAVEIERAIKQTGVVPGPGSTADLMIEGDIVSDGDKRVLKISRLVGPAQAS